MDSGIELESPLAYAASSEEPVGEMLRKAAALPDKEFVLVLKYDERFADMLLPAYLNAYIRFGEHAAKAKKLQIETLLFLGRSLKIEEAVEACTAKNSKKFILFANSSGALAEFRKGCRIKLGKRLKLNFDKSTALKTAIIGLDD